MELSTDHLTDSFGAYMSLSTDDFDLDTAFIDTLNRDFANEDVSFTRRFFCAS